MKIMYTVPVHTAIAITTNKYKQVNKNKHHMSEKWWRRTTKNYYVSYSFVFNFSVFCTTEWKKIPAAAAASKYSTSVCSIFFSFKCINYIWWRMICARTKNRIYICMCDGYIDK